MTTKASDYTDTEARAIAEGLSEAQKQYVLATPMQEPADAGVIAYRSGVLQGGGQFAGFARTHPSQRLFQRTKNCYGTAWQYRLSPLGLVVRAILQEQSNAG